MNRNFVMNSGGSTTLGIYNDYIFIMRNYSFAAEDFVLSSVDVLRNVFNGLISNGRCLCDCQCHINEMRNASVLEEIRLVCCANSLIML
jgi:hypothetical protein